MAGQGAGGETSGEGGGTGSQVPIGGSGPPPPPTQTPTGGSGMGAAEQMAALKAELASHQHTTGAKLRRSTRKHSYIKGNTRGFV